MNEEYQDEIEFEEFEDDDDDFDAFVAGLSDEAVENIGTHATIATTTGGSQPVGIPEGRSITIAEALNILGYSVAPGNQYFLDGTQVPIETEIGPGAFVTVVGTAKGG